MNARIKPSSKSTAKPPTLPSADPLGEWVERQQKRRRAALRLAVRSFRDASAMYREISQAHDEIAALGLDYNANAVHCDNHASDSNISRAYYSAMDTLARLILAGDPAAPANTDLVHVMHPGRAVVMDGRIYVAAPEQPDLYLAGKKLDTQVMWVHEIPLTDVEQLD